ncbi:hypothetical protein MML48_10g00004287 [Holotrichia oblita]|uniref:Uncharacterized protein n=1 Tax=Holotrichia oblita TaxID=644536 RepID=A0ACB9SGE8_HOLOL|nr:hypothetical protein MML48_10g00004287 [Holotrichia oblita]
MASKKYYTDKELYEILMNSDSEDEVIGAPEDSEEDDEWENISDVLLPDQDIDGASDTSDSDNEEYRFGMLKGRFRRLESFHNLNIQLICKCVMAACVLHNICILDKDVLEDLEPDADSTVEESDDENVGEAAIPQTKGRRDELYYYSTTEEDSGFGEDRNIESVDLNILRHKLYVEHGAGDDSKTIIGNRIVDIHYSLTETLKVQYNHSKQCTNGLLKPFYEKKKGLASVITLKCTFCEKLYIIHTHEPAPDGSSAINIMFVWSTLSSGSTYTQSRDILTGLDIFPLTSDLFLKIQDKLGDNWKDALRKNMEAAGTEERNLAIRDGQICDDWTPWISVQCDGGWSRRTYGHSYNSLSGTVTILDVNVAIYILLCHVVAGCTHWKRNRKSFICGSKK